MLKKYADLLKEVQENTTDSQQPDDKVLIIDGLNNFIRVFSAISTMNDDGEHIGGLVGFLKSIAAAIRQHNPTRCIIVFDGHGGSNRRRKLFKGYKSGRFSKSRLNRSIEYSNVQDEQQSLKAQLYKLIEYLDQLPIHTLSIDNIEADDTIAYIAKSLITKEVVIMSSDKDFLQLVDHRINIWSPTKKKLYTPELIKEEYGISSTNFIWYRALDGDKSDNIPGIGGVGLKTLKKYLPILTEDELVDYDKMVSYIDKQEKSYKLYESIKSSEDTINLNYRLMQLHDVDISGSIKSRIKDIVRSPIPQLNAFNFKRLFIRDKLYSNISNLEYWLNQSFRPLSRYSTVK